MKKIIIVMAMMVVLASSGWCGSPGIYFFGGGGGGSGTGDITAIGDANTGAAFVSSAPSGTIQYFWNPGGTFYTAIQGGNVAANRSWRLPIDAPPGAGLTEFLSIDEYGQMLMSTYAEVRTSLGLVVGTNVQVYDADLDDLADGSLTGTKVGFADTDTLWTATNVQAALEEMNDSINAGVPNGTGAKVNWSQLLGVPAGFADGTDDGAGATQLVDIVTTSPLRVNAGDNVNDALPGSDADITFSVNAATDSASGVIELSTDAESVTGTSDTVVVTPGTLTARLAAPGAIGGTTPAAGTFTQVTVAASANPLMELNDSDAPGTDKESFKIYSQYVDGADTAENHDATIALKQGGSYVDWLIMDESDDRFEFQKPISGTVQVTATGFDGNLATTDDTLQEVAQKFDDFSAGGVSAYEAGTEADFHGTILNPQGVYDNDGTNHAVTIAVNVPAAFTITAIYVSCDADPTTEPTLTFQHKAAGVGYGSPTTIEAVQTTAGVASVTTGIDDATIPANTKVFMTISDPDDALNEISWQIKGDWD